ncbi:MAG: hypothetical protein Kow0090_08170 [Myxococcota bacterium]
MDSKRKKYFGLLLAALSTSLFFSCGDGDEGENVEREGEEGENADDDDNDNDNNNDDGEISWRMPLDSPVCGMSSYEWLNPFQMGEIVEVKKLPLYSMSKEAIYDLLVENGYETKLEIKYGAETYLVRYETQDRGRKIEATAVVGYPRISRQEELAAPAVLWLHGTAGFMDDCAPSKQGAEGALPVVMMASQGYVAVAPDYIGMNGMGEPSEMFHPYLVGEATAIASWDSVRALQKFLDNIAMTAVYMDGRVIPWGGSQGGHAALFSALYAPYYAPEYEIPAAVALVPPTDLVRQSEEAVKAFGPATVTLGGALTAMSRWYGYFEELSAAIRNEEPYYIAELLPELMDTTCEVDQEAYEIDEVRDIYTDEFIKRLSSGVWADYDPWYCMMAENSLPFTSVERINTVPTLFQVSEFDELVNPAVEREAFVALCEMGFLFEYIECKDAGHTAGAIWSLEEQFKWVADRLAGVSLSNPCVRGEAVCCSGTDSGSCVEEE